MGWIHTARARGHFRIKAQGFLRCYFVCEPSPSLTPYTKGETNLKINDLKIFFPIRYKKTTRRNKTSWVVVHGDVMPCLIMVTRVHCYGTWDLRESGLKPAPCLRSQSSSTAYLPRPAVPLSSWWWGELKMEINVFVHPKDRLSCVFHTPEFLSAPEN